jgi:hypothetical protein
MRAAALLLSDTTVAHLCRPGVLSCTNGVMMASSQAEDRLEKLKEEAELAKSIAEEEDEF